MLLAAGDYAGMTPVIRCTNSKREASNMAVSYSDSQEKLLVEAVIRDRALASVLEAGDVTKLKMCSPLPCYDNRVQEEGWLSNQTRTAETQKSQTWTCESCQR